MIAVDNVISNPVGREVELPRSADWRGAPLVAVLIIGMAIAAIAPFDAAFAAVTFGLVIPRVALIAAMTLMGASCADRVGLPLKGHRTRWPMWTGVAAAIGVAIYVAALDGVIFRSTLAPSYVQVFETMRLRDRLLYFMLRAFNENLIYRLCVFSGLYYLISRIAGVSPQRVHPVLIWCAIVAAQVLNIAINVAALSPDPLSFGTLLYDFLRYVVPGVMWAWLYWRFGFVTAEVASVGCHVVLQPALGILL